eukprot:6213971-Pleurochrysis_carterae.AAC.1
MDLEVGRAQNLVTLCAQTLLQHMMEKDRSVSTSLVKTAMGRPKNASAGGTDQARMQAIQALVDVLQGEGHYAELMLGTAVSQQ